MFYRLGCLVTSLLLAASAHAQLITDRVRATAARDTLLRQSEQLWQRAEQTSAAFTTNARSRNHRRVIVQGFVQPQNAPSAQTGVRQSQLLAPDNIFWRHVTRYRRNGRVEEHFRITSGHHTLLKESRLNGNVVWLSIPVAYSRVMGTAIRHHGLYLRTGYVILDKDQYTLPNPMQ